MIDINSLTEQILKYAFKVPTALGPGLVYSSCKECLYYELKKNSIYCEKAKAHSLDYEEVKLNIDDRVDLHVENKVGIEIKSVVAKNGIYITQVLLI